MTFDPRQWNGELVDMGLDAGGVWCIQSIVGPRDASIAIRIRQAIRDYVHFGADVPADLFILSTGESPLRKTTKIGGLPYWHRDQEWPVSKSGRPLPFLAQFCFGESRDIIPEGLGEVLLLFGDPRSASELAMNWGPACLDTELITADELPVRSWVPPYFGTRWRTANYPRWEPLNDCWSAVHLADGTTLLNPYLVLELLGMQIGASPFVLPGQLTMTGGERILCSLCSVFPSVDCQYPFLNRRAPLTLKESTALSLNISNIDDDGFGVLYIIATEEGKLRWQLGEL